MRIDTLIFSLLIVFSGIVLLMFRQWRGRRIERRSADRIEELRQAGVTVPPTLHPVIDPTRCIGSATCTKICPQGNDVIGLIGGRGTLVDPSVCIGHGRCAANCPMDAIRLVFGTSERGVDIPYLSQEFETNVPGIYITGELGGMGLIVNAVRQAQKGMAHLVDSLKHTEMGTNSGDIMDVVIVGAGPAGLTCALAAKSAGLRFRWVEQEEIFGGSILHYPRGKIVMTSPVDLPLAGRVHAGTLSKEKLVALWEKIITSQNLVLETGTRVESISPASGGVFEVATSSGNVIGRKVMLCIGRRGSPRKLGVSGEDLPKVSYSLREPDMFAGKRVLVVGGGDSAIEAACQLAEDTDADLTLSYRREALSRIKPGNRKRFDALVVAGRINPIFNSQVKAIEQEQVMLDVVRGYTTIPNDFVLVFAGGVLPVPLLEKAGIRFERHYGEETERHKKLVAEDVFDEIRNQRKNPVSKAIRDKNRSLWIPTVAVSIVLIAVLFGLGYEHYWSLISGSAVDRKSLFRPAGLWGHGIGFLAMGLMSLNLLYFARKEFRVLRNLGPIRVWLGLHIGSGLLAAALVVLHTTLIMNNLFALFLYISLGIVVLTGLAGRYIYAFIPHDPRGLPLTQASLLAISDRMRAEFDHEFEGLTSMDEFRRVLSQEAISENSLSLWKSVIGIFTRWPNNYFRLNSMLRKTRREFPDKEQHARFATYCREVMRLGFELEYLPHLKKLLGGWKAGHGVLAVLMILLVIAHVVIEFWVGYRWIL